MEGVRPRISDFFCYALRPFFDLIDIALFLISDYGFRLVSFVVLVWCDLVVVPSCDSCHILSHFTTMNQCFDDEELYSPGKVVPGTFVRRESTLIEKVKFKICDHECCWYLVTSRLCAVAQEQADVDPRALVDGSFFSRNVVLYTVRLGVEQHRNW